MDFKKATDDLFDAISHEDLARILGVSIATVRQARLQPTAKAHRSPPDAWEDAVVRLAGQQIQRYRQLISALTSERQHALFAEPSGSRKPR